MIYTFTHLIPKNFDGITLYPFIFVRHPYLKQQAIFINHEKIHLQQQKELGILFFYLFYGLEFLFRWIQYKNSLEAYYQISFEKEAYQQEKNLQYLSTRKWWSFCNYL